MSASQKPHSIRTFTFKNNSTWKTLANNFISSQHVQKNLPALEYGLKYEKIALLAYIKMFNVKVISVGVVVMPDKPHICASADGIVVEDGCADRVLEIKNPSSCSKKPVFDKDTSKFNVTYLEKVDKITKLRTSNIYFTQCQMIMYVCGLLECDLFVWSPVKKW